MQGRISLQICLSQRIRFGTCRSRRYHQRILKFSIFLGADGGKTLQKHPYNIGKWNYYNLGKSGETRRGSQPKTHLMGLWAPFRSKGAMRETSKRRYLPPNFFLLEKSLHFSPVGCLTDLPKIEWVLGAPRNFLFFMPWFSFNEPFWLNKDDINLLLIWKRSGERKKAREEKKTQLCRKWIIVLWRPLWKEKESPKTFKQRSCSCAGPEERSAELGGHSSLRPDCAAELVALHSLEGRGRRARQLGNTGCMSLDGGTPCHRKWGECLA